MKYKINKVFIFFAIWTVLLPSVYFAICMIEKSKDAKAVVADEFYKATLKTVRMHIEDALKVCQITQRTNITEYERASEAIREIIMKLGSVQIDNNFILANTYHQNKPEVLTHSDIPIIKFGDTPITPQKDSSDNLSSNCKILDSHIRTIKNDTNIDVSIMVKTNDAGSMLRIATTILQSNGKLFLASSFDNTPETQEIARTLLARRTYQGILKIGETHYLAIYEPLIDQYGEVIGAIEFLKNFDDFNYIFDSLSSVRISDNCYLWGLQLDYANTPSIKFFRDTKKSVQSNNDLQELKEIQESIPDIVYTSLSTGDSKVMFKNIESFENDIDQLIAFAYFKPWNMIFGITINKENLQTNAQNLESQIDKRIALLFPIFIILLAIAVMKAKSLSQKIVNEIIGISNAIECIQKFDNQTALKLLHNSQSNLLMIAEVEEVRKFTLITADTLEKLLRNIKIKVANFAESSKDIAEKSLHIEKASENKSSKLSDIQNSLNLINKTAEILNEGATEAIVGIEKSINEMKDGTTLLIELENNAKALMSDSQNIALLLSVIKDKADKISNVVNSIKSVSERINMLAVNASMEAERNIEISGGFKDVSNEITKLSDITAVSAMRISEMASAMCKSVNLGVSEMKKFSLIMHGCKDSIKNVRESVFVAQETTLELSPKFDELSKGISTHTDNISNIEKNLIKLSEKSTESKSVISSLSHKTTTINTIATVAIPSKLPKK